MKLLVQSAIAVLLATPAFAADAVVADPQPIAVNGFSWSGGYIGINAGYAGGEFKNPFSLYSLDVDEDISGTLNNKSNGFVGGVQAGYNWQFDRTVFGLETDFQGSSVEGDFADVEIDDDGITAYGLKNKVEWFGTMRARLGYLPTERFLVYATGGAAYGKVKTSFGLDYDGDDESLEVSASGSKVKWGYTVGAGAEYAVSDNWTLKTEYLYTDLGKAKLFSYADEDLGIGADIDTKYKFHTVRVGLNYKF